MSGKLDILAAGLFVLGFTAMTTTLAILLARLRQRAVVQKREGRRVWQLLLLFVGIVLVVVSQFVFWFDSGLNDYMVFNEDDPLAIVEFETSPDLGKIMTVSYRAPTKGSMISNRVVMEEDIAVLELETIDFSPALSFLDLGLFHRISAVRQIDQTEQSASVGHVVEFQADSGRIFDFLRSISGVIPIANVDRNFSEPVVFQEGERVRIFASEEGFSLVSNQ